MHTDDIEPSYIDAIEPLSQFEQNAITIALNRLLNTLEEDFLVACLKKIKTKPKINFLNQLTISLEYFQSVSESKDYTYRDLYTVTESFYRHSLLLELEPKKFVKMRVANLVLCNRDLEAAVIVQFSQKFAQWLEEVSKRGRSNFKTDYAAKLYHSFKECKNSHKIMTIVEIRQILAIDNKYAKTSQFKKWIIDPSIAEINKITDIEVSYTYIKESRLITALDFMIVKKYSEESKNV